MIVSSIRALQKITTVPAEPVVVTDVNRGGTFTYSNASLTDDNGIIFAATAIGSGHWVRNWTPGEVIDAAWYNLSGIGTINFTGTGTDDITVTGLYTP